MILEKALLNSAHVSIYSYILKMHIILNICELMI